MSSTRTPRDIAFRHPDLPGGSFVQALWHRDLMRLSDRGRASEMVGERWAAMCAEALEGWCGTDRPVPGESDLTTYRVDRIARLDDIPAIAAAASLNKLQNPDFLLIGTGANSTVLQPADAKFSIETAKASQVSAEVASQLLSLGPVITDHMPEVAATSTVVDGFFLSPDFSLTHFMLARQPGSRPRVSVRLDQIELLPADPAEFMRHMAGADLALWLADKDGFPVSPESSLLAFLYAFRLARACVGCWADEHGPLLAYKDTPVIDLAAVAEEARTFDRDTRSAWALLLAWDGRAESVRRQRAAVDQVTGLPMASAELRARVEQQAKALGVEAPSASRVRRIVGAWFRQQLRDQFGPILPPVVDFEGVLGQLQAASRALRDDAFARIDAVVAESRSVAGIAPD